MYSEKRREDRDAAEISVGLHLCSRDEEALCNPFCGLIANMSSYGACILLEKIREGSHHLFYTPRDNSSCVLFLKVSFSENDTFSVPVWPVWFDRLLWEDAKPFQVGVEFLLHPHDDQIERLKKLIKENKEKPGNLTEILSQCRTA